MSEQRKVFSRNQERILQRHKEKKKQRRMAASLSVLICMSIIIPIVLPAFTLDTETFCGMAEHTHTEECYTISRELTCGLVEGEPEQIPEENVVNMNEARTAVTDENQTSLVPHVHTEACYEYPEPEEVVTYVPIEVPVEPEASENAEAVDASAESNSELPSLETVQNEIPQTQTVMQEVVTYVQPDPVLICGYEEGELVPQTVSQNGEATAQEGEAAVQNGEAAASEPKLHVHTDACYTETKVLTCQIPEHTHEEMCFSNRNAGVETAGDWEYMFVNLAYTHDWAKDLVTVAKTQLGYHDKSENFILNEDGSRSFYSRYGAWYGIPYGDWCAMFASFCLNYAKIPDTFVPRAAACGAWVQDFKAKGLYRDLKTEEYTPAEGDLVFFRWLDSGENVVDHVGIVSKVTETGIVTIEGNMSHEVGSFSYTFGDLTIIGYAQLPVNPEFAAKEMSDQAEESTERAEETAASSETNSGTSAENENSESVPEKITAFPAVHLEADAEDGTRVLVDAPEGALPEGVQLFAAAVESETVAEAVENAIEGNVVYATAVDITFKDVAGNEIEPAKNIHVNIIPARLPAEIATDAAPMLVHIDNEGEATVVEQVEETVGDTGSVTFESNEFSVYVVAYTVDFYYGSYEWHIDGGSEIRLSELFEALQIDKNASDAVSVEFTDPHLISVSEVFDAANEERTDWLLTSLEAFDTVETLTVRFADNGILEIRVEDAQNELLADITEYYYSSNNSTYGYIVLTDSSGNINQADTDAGRSALNSSGTTSNRWAIPVANEGYRFVNWTNEGQPYTRYSPRGGGWDYGAYAIRPNKTQNDHTTNMFVANFVPENDFLVTIVAGEGGYTTVGSDPDRHTIRYSELLALDIGIIAWANDGYRSLGWVDEAGNVIGGLHAGDRRLYSDAVPTGRDCVVTAIFEEIQDFNIYYRTNGTLGSVSATHEIVHKGQEPIGSVATPREGYQFIGWVDQNGVTVGWFPEFIPYGDLIREAAIYTAVFESAAYSKVLRVQAETDNGHPLGYVISPDYETSVNGHIVTMNVTDFDTTPAAMTAIAYEDWVFDHWELNGNTLKDPDDPAKDLGATIPKGYDLSSYDVMDGTYNVLIAHFKVDDDPTVHRITYKTEAGGTITGLGGRIDENGNPYDTWIGSHSAGNIHGARVVANNGYEFKGWKTEVKDANGNGTGQYMFPSYQATFVPQGDLITDATYIATYIPAKNMVGYNLNIADVPVSWTGPGSESDGLVVAAGNQNPTTEYYSPMYYPNHYYGYLERFSLTTAIPEAEGYYFIGWYNKNRPEASGKEYVYSYQNGGWGNYGQNVSHPKTNGNIIARGSRVDDEGHDMNNIYFPYKSGKNRYTFEAFYVTIKGDSKRLPYDGQNHQLVAEADLFEGSVEGTERFRAQLDRMKREGKYNLGAVKYQLIDDNGNPIGEPTDSFERLDPGFYRVRAYADGHFDTHNFTIEKIITLEIYPAKLIIKKYWQNDEGMNIRPEQLEVEKKRNNPHTQGYADPENAAVREAMEKDAANMPETPENLYGPRTKTEEEMTHIAKGDPAWTVEGDVWTRVYENILVRDPAYLEDEQNSGWYVHFAEEKVPDGYRLVNQTWERSPDRLTTTITFVNEPVTKRITFEKKDQDGNLLENAEFTLEMLKNFKGEQVSASPVEFKLGTVSTDLVYGYYCLTETKAPEGGYVILEDPIYFMIDIGGLHPTDASGNILKGEGGAEITRTDDVVYLDSSVTVINGLTDIKLKKVDSQNKTKLLDGAVFQLLDQNGRPIEKTIGNLRSVTLKDGSVVTNALVTSEGGASEITGLPNGSYILREVQAPDNYAIIEKDLYFTVKNGKAYNANHQEVKDLTFTVENSLGVMLPETGDLGTSRLYLLGATLILGAALIWIRRRRKRYNIL